MIVRVLFSPYLCDFTPSILDKTARVLALPPQESQAGMESFMILSSAHAGDATRAIPRSKAAEKQKIRRESIIIFLLSKLVCIGEYLLKSIFRYYFYSSQ